jgi:hypothetical protein
MTLRQPAGGDRTANFSSTPRALAAARVAAARNAKFDRTKYETVRSLPRLNAFIERARDSGLVAIDVTAASLDPMQAELCGFSLAARAAPAGCSAATSRPTRYPNARRWKRSSRFSPTWACSRSATT